MLTERERIRILAQTKRERLKAEAIDILIDALHRQTRGGATVSFDHDLALKIEKLIIGNMQREKIIELVRIWGCPPALSAAATSVSNHSPLCALR